MKLRRGLVLSLALGLLSGPALSFEVQNLSGWPVEVKVYKGQFADGNFHVQRLESGPTTAKCGYDQKGCNPDAPNPRAELTAEIRAGGFLCRVKLLARGYVTVYAVTPLRWREGQPKAFQCVSQFDENGSTTTIATEPTALDHKIRNVHFLGTADPQYENGNTSLAAVSDRNAQVMLSKLTGDMRGIVVAGDLTQNSRRIDEYGAYDRSWSGMRRWVFDGYGNHDAINPTPNERLACQVNNVACVDPGWIWDALLAQGRVTRTISSVSTVAAYPPHYAWTWDDVHFIQLDLYAGSTAFMDHSPNQADQFLKSYLIKHVGTSGEPVVLIQHYAPTLPDEFWPAGDPSYLDLWNTLASFNVLAFLVGHDHPGPNDSWQYTWTKPGGSGSSDSDSDSKGIPVFVIGAGLKGAFTEMTITDDVFILNRWDSGTNKVVSSTTIKYHSETPLYLGNGKCLDVPRGEFDGLVNGIKVQQWICNDQPNQLWHIEGGTIRAPNGKCLDLSGDDWASKRDGGKVQLWDCNGLGPQSWSWDGQRLKNQNGKCLDVHFDDYQGQIDGGRVQVWTCNDNASQRWFTTKPGQTDAAPGAPIYSSNGQCLDVEGSAYARRDPGAVVQGWHCSGGPNESWTFDHDRIVSANGQCLDLNGPDWASKRDGGKIQLWPCNQQPPQKWHYDQNTKRIVNDNGLCLDMDRGDFDFGKNPARLQSYRCNDQPNQQWVLTPQGSAAAAQLVSSNGKCVDVEGGAYTSQSSGGTVQTWTCQSGVFIRKNGNQLFALDHNRLVMPNGLCLEVEQGGWQGGVDGARVQSTPCNWENRQLWRRDGRRVVSSNGKCLDIERGAYNRNADQSPLQAWKCNGEPNQDWK